jgi:glycosyltransferase involved in cell wall biosynthesis
VLLQTVERARTSGEPIQVFAGSAGTGAPVGASLVAIDPVLPKRLAPIPPIRFMPGLQQFLVFDRFDRAAAKAMQGAPSTTIGFSGQALHTFARARALGCTRFEIVSPTAHLAHVWTQHRLAAARYPIEGDWLNRRHLQKALREYEIADVIHVPSEYAERTFVDRGVPPSKLRRMPLAADRRFAPQAGVARTDSRFRIVYTGYLSVVKGVPLLMDAFGKLDDRDAELVLVGSTGTRGMRRFVEGRCAADPRIRLAPGDPLPHLRAANVYVHPSYQDGFGYAGAEALACGVPAIVTHDTGAKELITSGVNGEVIPTDDPASLLAALRDRCLARQM